MNRYAISFTVRAGSEPQVAGVLRNYRRPPAGAAAGGPPLLRRTSVFMAGQRVVRVMDVDGDLATVMRHLASQPQIRAVEAALDPLLSTPRDLDSAEGVRAFLHHALLSPAPQALTPELALPDVEVDQRGQRCGLLYPVRPGAGKEAARLVAELTEVAGRAGAPNGSASITTFHRGDVLVGLLEANGSVDDALHQLALSAARAPGAAALAGVLATDADLTTESGFRGFLDDCQMELLTDRRVEVPV